MDAHDHDNYDRDDNEFVEFVPLQPDDYDNDEGYWVENEDGSLRVVRRSGAGPKKPKQQFDDDRLVVRAWSELDDEPDREMVVEDIVFKQGVTSIVAPYGGGKTVFGAALAMTIGTGGTWAGERIEQMPVLWAAADDRRTLQLVRKTWLAENPGRSLMKEGGWINGPVTFSDVGKTRELIQWLKGKPPMLIVLDMLTDMFGDLDDEKGKDAIRVFKNIWLVVRETGATFLCLQ
jgi:hypothetical protein